MTHQPLTKAEREELQAFAADRMNVSVYSGELIEKALADLVAAEADASELRNILLCHNFAPCDTAACNCNGWHERATGNGFYARFREIEEAVGDHNGKTLLKAVQEIVAQRDRAEADLDAERKMRVEAEAAAKRAEEERDALKAKLDDPRRVLIHETEVVATKEEIAKLKKDLADLSEADEELHKCRALVNATSENLSVDLERMVDDLAEANEKAARSEKDAHSWCGLYTNTKAKLAALVERAESTVFQGLTEDQPAKLIPSESLRGNLINLRAAIAAAKGGMS